VKQPAIAELVHASKTLFAGIATGMRVIAGNTPITVWDCWTRSREVVMERTLDDPKEKRATSGRRSSRNSCGVEIERGQASSRCFRGLCAASEFGQTGYVESSATAAKQSTGSMSLTTQIEKNGTGDGQHAKVRTWRKIIRHNVERLGRKLPSDSIVEAEFARFAMRPTAYGLTGSTVFSSLSGPLAMPTQFPSQGSAVRVIWGADSLGRHVLSLCVKPCLHL